MVCAHKCDLLIRASSHSLLDIVVLVSAQRHTFTTHSWPTTSSKHSLACAVSDAGVSSAFAGCSLEFHMTFTHFLSAADF